MCLLALLTCCSVGIDRIGSALDLWFNSFVPIFLEQSQADHKIITSCVGSVECCCGAKPSPSPGSTREIITSARSSFLSQTIKGRVFFFFKEHRERGCYNSSAVGEMKIVYQPNYVSLPWKSIPKGVRNGMSSFRGNAGEDLSAARWLCALSLHSPGISQGWGRQKKSLIPLAQEIGMGTKEMLRRCWALLGLRM